MSINRTFLPLALISSLGLLGCSSLGDAVRNTAQAYWNSRTPPSFANTPLKAEYTYLEVLGPGSSALMVLAQVDTPSAPTDQPKRPVETWVSASGEVLRTQSGFVVGSAGVPYLPQLVQTQWGGNGAPSATVVHMPSAGVFNLPMVWQTANVPAALLNKPTPLLQRAHKVGNLKLSAWAAQAQANAPRVQAAEAQFQVVGTHPITGNLVYGQYCVGSMPGSNCIEYLLRTAASNL